MMKTQKTQERARGGLTTAREMEYFAVDLQDAVGTARLMAKERDKMKHGFVWINITSPNGELLDRVKVCSEVVYLNNEEDDALTVKRGASDLENLAARYCEGA